MLDIEEQLRRYAEAAETAVPSPRATVRKRPSRLLAAAAVVVLAGIGAAVASTQGDDDPITADSTGVHVLPVPDVGASPEQLTDGTPVWVVRHEDGTVSVLDARSTHEPFGVGRLVGWCANGGFLLDPEHGSLYDARGAKVAGPAPTGLASYPVEATQGDRVTISLPAVPQDRGSSLHPDSETCSTELTLHEPNAWPSVAADEVANQRGLVRIEDAELVLRVGETAVLCTGDRVESEPPRCSGVPAPELALTGDLAWAVLRGDIVARPHAGEVVDIAFVDDATTRTSDGEASAISLSERLLAVDDVRALLPSLPLRRVDGRDHGILGPEEMTGVTRGGLEGVTRQWAGESASSQPGSEPAPRVLNVLATVITYASAVDASEAAGAMRSLMREVSGRPVDGVPSGYTAFTAEDAPPARSWFAFATEGDVLVALQVSGFGDQEAVFLRLLRAFDERAGD